MKHRKALHKILSLINTSSSLWSFYHWFSLLFKKQHPVLFCMIKFQEWLFIAKVDFHVNICWGIIVDSKLNAMINNLWLKSMLHLAAGNLLSYIFVLTFPCQSEYQRGVSAWNFDLEDLKAQASLVCLVFICELWTNL